MRINLGETKQDYLKRIEEWHNWFAWYPVRLENKEGRWLETVERRSTYCMWHGDREWVYRALEEII